MENLIFSLNATVPVFLMMILGLVFKKIGWIDDIFASKMNKFVFMVPLPVLVFEDLATVDFSKVWDVKFVLFCFIVTMISITISFLISCLLGDKTIRGEFIQAAYRSSAALLGIAFIQNIYGTTGMAPLMIIGSVPLYNVMAVLVLSLFKPGQQGLDRAMWKRTLTTWRKRQFFIFIWHICIRTLTETEEPHGFCSSGISCSAVMRRLCLYLCQHLSAAAAAVTIRHTNR